MNRPARAIVGALVGAVLTLAAHPYSRPRLFAGLIAWTSSPDKQTIDPLDRLDVLPQPKTLADFSLWMDAGARRVVGRYPTEPRDWRNLTAAAASAASLDPDNAFWFQMKAVFGLSLKERDRSRTDWLRASKLPRWDDLQTQRLLDFRRRLEQSVGPGAWTACVVYPKRSSAPSQAIEGFARDIARTTATSDVQGLRLRHATVLNGKLMRDGARSMLVAERGVATIELASYPSNLISIDSPRKLLLARTELYNALLARKMDVAATETDRTFRDNDSWLGYPTSEEASQDYAGRAWTAFGLIVAPALLLLAAGIGWLLTILAWLLSKTSRWEVLIGPPWIVGLGLIAAIVVQATTRSALTTIVVTAATTFLVFAPHRTRSNPIFDLGPLHGFLTVILSGLVCLGLGGLIGAMTTPGQELLAEIGDPIQALGGYRAALAILALGASTLALVAAFYANAFRIATPAVLTYSIDRLGRGLGWFGLAAFVVGAPAILLGDRALDQHMTQRVMNEPVHYLVND